MLVTQSFVKGIVIFKLDLPRDLCVILRVIILVTTRDITRDIKPDVARAFCVVVTLIY